MPNALDQQNRLSAVPALGAFQFPGREATDVNVKRVDVGRRAVACELNLWLQLVPLDSFATYHAKLTDPRPAPHTVRSSGGEFFSADRFVGLLSNTQFACQGVWHGARYVILSSGR